MGPTNQSSNERFCTSSSPSIYVVPFIWGSGALMFGLPIGLRAHLDIWSWCLAAIAAGYVWLIFQSPPRATVRVLNDGTAAVELRYFDGALNWSGPTPRIASVMLQTFESSDASPGDCCCIHVDGIGQIDLDGWNDEKAQALATALGIEVTRTKTDSSERVFGLNRRQLKTLLSDGVPHTA